MTIPSSGTTVEGSGLTGSRQLWAHLSSTPLPLTGSLESCGTTTSTLSDGSNWKPNLAEKSQSLSDQK